MSWALSVTLRAHNDTLFVEVGQAKWADKAAAAAASIFVLWPLAITAGVGVWQQKQLQQHTFDFIQQQLMSGQFLASA